MEDRCALVPKHTGYSVLPNTVQLPTSELDCYVLTHYSPSLGGCFNMPLGRRRALQSTMFNPVLPEPTWNCSLTFYSFVIQF
jgi:hypothetical protein